MDDINYNFDIKSLKNFGLTIFYMNTDGIKKRNVINSKIIDFMIDIIHSFLIITGN